jgi:hypothetical protein
MQTRSANKVHRVSRLIRFLCLACVLASYPTSLSVRESQAQAELEIRGSISLRITRGRLLFRIGEVVNLSPSKLPSERIELALWLSRKPYDPTQELKGAKLASCSFAGITGGDVMASASCQGKLKFISRGKYYVIITLSELDSATNTPVMRDSFTFSKRLKF